MQETTKMIFPDWYECKYDKDVLALANHLGRKAPKEICALTSGWLMMPMSGYRLQ